MSVFLAFASSTSYAAARSDPPETVSTTTAMSNDLPPHSIAPTHSSTSLRHKPHRSSRLIPRGGGQNDDSDDDVGTSFERSIMSLANSASKAVRAQGVCSSDATCGGFIQFAQVSGLSLDEKGNQRQSFPS